MNKNTQSSKTQYLVSGTQFIPVGDLRDISSSLPVGVYVIRNLPFQGTILEQRVQVDMSVPKKIYGRIPAMLEKTFAAFKRRPRSTGVLLTGERGMGKSMFARCAMVTAIENGFPVIIVDGGCKVSETVGILEMITQPIVVIMDEFEKNFPDDADKDEDAKNEQNRFLSMLDGIGSSEKRLFIATANDTDDLNEYMLNRPGRFYYHFEFRTLTHDEMSEYLEGECDPKVVSKKDIQYAVSCMGTYAINYDGISAVVEELNAGSSIQDALRDLNLDRDGESGYLASVIINGVEYTTELYNDLEDIRTSTKYRENFYGELPATYTDKKTIGRTDPPGSVIEITFDGRKVKLNKEGLAIIPKTAISKIKLVSHELKVGGKSFGDFEPSKLANVGDIRLLSLKRERRPLYLVDR